jgi:phage recombination protein Bet
MEEIMGNELAVAGNRETRLAMPVPEFSTEQIRILAETVAKGCDQNELGFFLTVCKLKRLDPFSHQVHCVKRWDSDLGREKMVIQVGIDGFRVIAVRTEELAGISEPEYDSEDGDHPNWARVVVYRYGRDNEKIPYSVKARWSEYVQTKKDGTPNRMWAKMPYIMLAKCSEAMALRKAFPDELSGMYSDEEMGQADNEGTTTPASVMGGKPPVSMPRSTDEKKEPEKKPAPQQGKAETVQQGKAETVAQNASQGQPAAQQGPDKLSGEITQVTPGKNGVLVLAVNGSVVVVPGKFSTDDFVVGAKLLCSVIKSKVRGQVVLEVTEVEMIVPPVVEGEIVDAEFTEVDENPVEDNPKGSDPVLDEARAAGLGGIFDDAPSKQQAAVETPAAGGEADKPGTAGMKRAKRLHTLVTQNHKNTGFTEDLLKKYLATQRLEHARDLACPPKGSDAFNAYEYACSMAVGEVDWHEILED